MPEFDFENLNVYQRAITYVDRIFSLTDRFPTRLQYSLGDQLRRAALSIPNNIAEGSNKSSDRDKSRYFEYALDSARECIPMLTICFKRGLLTEHDHDLLRSECVVICRMMSRLIHNIS